MYINSDTIAVFSYNTLDLFPTFCEPSDVIKRAAILFNRLLFHPQGIPKEYKKRRTKVELLADIAAKYEHEREYLRRSQEFSDFILLTDELVEDTESFYRKIYNISRESSAKWKIDDLYSSARFKKTVGLHPDPEDIHTWYSWKLTLFLDFCLFDVAKEMFPNAVGLFSDLHKEVIRFATNKVNNEAQEIELITRLETLSIADFAKISWPKIFELRKSEFLANFRHRLSEIANVQASSSKNIDIEVFSDLWNLMADFRPDLPRSYFTAILGNLPLPIILNPVSLLAAVKDIKKQHTLKKQYGWLFFIQEAKKKQLRT